MIVLGLTGGIGSGKTTVANMFSELGVPVYIADQVGKKLINEDPEVIAKIKILLGSRVFSQGRPDRKKIARVVFDDKEKLHLLNQIVHPAVAKDFQNWLNKQHAPYIVYEAAILFETGGHHKCDYTLLITAPFKERIERLKERDNSTSEEIQARMNHQWDDQKKAQLADFIIENRDLSTTKKAVQGLHEKLWKSA